MRSGASVSSSDSACEEVEEEVSSDRRRVRVVEISVIGTWARRLLGKDKIR